MPRHGEGLVLHWAIYASMQRMRKCTENHTEKYIYTCCRLEIANCIDSYLNCLTHVLDVYKALHDSTEFKKGITEIRRLKRKHTQIVYKSNVLACRKQCNSSVFLNTWKTILSESGTSNVDLIPIQSSQWI